jgi:hypothetical protein
MQRVHQLTGLSKTPYWSVAEKRSLRAAFLQTTKLTT